MRRFQALLAWALLCLSLPALGAPLGRVSGVFKTDNFGYRPQDAKWAVAVADPGPGLQLRREADDAAVWTLPPEAVRDLGQESGEPLIHGDHVWRIDFSGLRVAGRYHLYSPSLRQRSYDFAIAPDPYGRAALAVAKSYYYQRCGSPKEEAYGGAWHDDEACHGDDAQAQPLCGQGRDYGAMDYGTLDLAGGWHDAGDFEKKIGISKDCDQDAYADCGQTLWYLLNAYEAAPAYFQAHGLRLPESRDGVPDLLAQAKWELDWYLKMQRPDGHVLAKVVVRNLGAFKSPPSLDDNPRWYGPPTHDAEAIFVACVAHAARVYAQVPFYAAYAQRLRTAASVTWGLWVAQAPESDYRFWAAAELFRLGLDRDEAAEAIRSFRAWNGSDTLALTSVQTFGAFSYLMSPGADPAMAAAMRASLGRLVDQVFDQDDSYGSGMPAWLYSWNSNWYKADCGQLLLWGARLGATGKHSAQECRAHAQGFLHYLHGLNPLGMTYMTHASALGAPHGAWRVFNVWWGNSAVEESRRLYVGKPAGEADPLYPYEAGEDNFGVADDGESELGPPPGFVPPGPTSQYFKLGGQSTPPLAGPGRGRPYAKAYRDWNWVDPGGKLSQPWIVNEAGIYDQAAYLGLAAQFLGPAPAP